MSPRAAWRLEALGYVPVYDYAMGKADWLAAALPTVSGGDRPARVADAMARDVPTCRPDNLITDIVAGSAARHGICVVVNEQRVVVGRLRIARLDPTDRRTAAEAMEPGPTTIRADADLAETRERMRRRKAPSLVVTDPDGVLLGVVRAN